MDSKSFSHIPVLFDDCMEGLAIKPDGVYYDATLGLGGHSRGILERLTTGRLIATDKDEQAIATAKERLAEYTDKLTVIHDDYKNVIPHLKELNIDALDGILVDMGVSSYQLDDAERGFSYMKDAPLDMRMDRTQELSAYEIVNGYAEEKLADVIYLFGEERYSRRIAAKIVERRKKQPIATTLELSGIVESCYPAKERFKFGNPSKRTFQAIRIEVNGELSGLKECIMSLARYLKVGGRMCVITFHSLEDRIVKHAFKELEADCLCDKHALVCTCGKRKEVEIITKKPISGSKESEENRRAESAKLRIVEKI